MPIGEVFDRFRSFPLDTVLGVTQRVEYLLATSDRPDSAVQDRIGAGLFGANTWARLVDKSRRWSRASGTRQHRPLFWHTQLAINASKVALLACPDTVRSESADFVDLGEAILGLSDHLDPRIDTAAPDSLDTALRHHLIVNAVFNEAEDLHAHLALGRRLYLDDHAGLRQHPNWMDLSQLIAENVGVDPETLTAVGVAVFAFFRSQRHETIHDNARALDLYAYLSSTSISEAQIAAFLSVVSRSSDDMRAAVAARYAENDLRPFCFRPFAETPLVQIGRRQYCISMKLLTRRITSDLHFLFVQHLAEDVKQRYFSFHGMAFERLVHETLAKVSRRHRKLRNSTSAIKYYRIDEYERASGDRRADGVVVKGKTAVVLDAKAGRLPAPVMAGDWDALDTYLSGTLVKAARQIDATIRRLRSGELTLPGTGRIQQFVPMVVTLQYVGWNPLLQAWLDGVLQAEGILQDMDTLPIQVSELASLMRVADVPRSPPHDCVGLLIQRASNPGLRALSLHNFLVQLGPRFAWDAPSLRREAAAFFDRASNLMALPAPGAS